MTPPGGRPRHAPAACLPPSDDDQPRQHDQRRADQHRPARALAEKRDAEARAEGQAQVAERRDGGDGTGAHRAHQGAIGEGADKHRGHQAGGRDRARHDRRRALPGPGMPARDNRADEASEAQHCHAKGARRGAAASTIQSAPMRSDRRPVSGMITGAPSRRSQRDGRGYPAPPTGKGPPWGSGRLACQTLSLTARSILPAEHGTATRANLVSKGLPFGSVRTSPHFARPPTITSSARSAAPRVRRM